MRRINVEKSKVITLENAEDWCYEQMTDDGFLKITAGYFSNSADFKVYDNAELFAVKHTCERPFYGVESGKVVGMCYTYFIPASEAVFEGE